MAAAFDPSTINRIEFRKTATRVLVLARLVASITGFEKDDIAVELIAHLIEDDDHFDQLCRLIGIP